MRDERRSQHYLNQLACAVTTPSSTTIRWHRNAHGLVGGAVGVVGVDVFDGDLFFQDDFHGAAADLADGGGFEVVMFAGVDGKAAVHGVVDAVGLAAGIVIDLGGSGDGVDFLGQLLVGLGSGGGHELVDVFSEHDFLDDFGDDDEDGDGADDFDDFGQGMAPVRVVKR